MAIRKIRTMGDRILNKVCRPVEEMTPKIQELIDDMLETMYDAYGVGLAAPQVTYVTHELKEKGWDIDTDATTVEEAKNAILKALKRPLKSMVSEKTDPGKGAAL